MPKRPLKVREFLNKLKPYGVVSFSKKGKGSERILLRPVVGDDRPDEGTDPQKAPKGPQIPIKYHGGGTELSIPVIKAVLRRFDIPEDEFWD